MQLPPAFSLPDHEPILRAIDLAYERDFSFIPVLSRARKPIGYIDVAALKSKFESGKTNPVRNPISSCCSSIIQHSAGRSSAHTYNSLRSLPEARGLHYHYAYDTSS